MPDRRPRQRYRAGKRARWAISGCRECTPGLQNGWSCCPLTTPRARSSLVARRVGEAFVRAGLAASVRRIAPDVSHGRTARISSSRGGALPRRTATSVCSPASSSPSAPLRVGQIHVGAHSAADPDRHAQEDLDRRVPEREAIGLWVISDRAGWLVDPNYQGLLELAARAGIGAADEMPPQPALVDPGRWPTSARVARRRWGQAAAGVAQQRRWSDDAAAARTAPASRQLSDPAATPSSPSPLRSHSAQTSRGSSRRGSRHGDVSQLSPPSGAR
jgi:hypothetical protein